MALALTAVVPPSTLGRGRGERREGNILKINDKTKLSVCWVTFEKGLSFGI